MYQKTFVCLCRRTVNPTYTIFNTVHAISDMSNIFKFQNIWRIFTRVRARTDGQTDRQTNRMHKHFSTLFESVKNEIIKSKISRSQRKLAGQGPGWNFKLSFGLDRAQAEFSMSLLGRTGPKSSRNFCFSSGQAKITGMRAEPVPDFKNPAHVDL